MHPVNIEMIQFLIVSMVRDDSKSSGTDPNPEILLKGLCGIEGPDLPASHFHKTKIGVDVITGFGIYMTKVM